VNDLQQALRRQYAADWFDAFNDLLASASIYSLHFAEGQAGDLPWLLEQLTRSAAGLRRVEEGRGPAAPAGPPCDLPPLPAELYRAALAADPEALEAVGRRFRAYEQFAYDFAPYFGLPSE
jgi:hypothetical protein